jgi:hypothetical protein
MAFYVESSSSCAICRPKRNEEGQLAPWDESAGIRRGKSWVEDTIGYLVRRRLRSRAEAGKTRFGVVDVTIKGNSTWFVLPGCTPFELMGFGG